MINLQNITIRRGQRTLLEQANWTIYAHQRIGIIGANGTGKSTLFSLLLRELTPDDGTLSIPSGLIMAHVAQESARENKSALDFVMDGDGELRALQDQLQQAETEHDGMRIANVHAQLDAIDAYTAPSRAAQLLDGLGFNQGEQSLPVSSFSGGWRVRLNLAKALMTRSDMLLLDEPTNHLDLDAVLWLEQWLKKYTGTLLIISHDRDFLDATVNHILCFSQQQLQLYSGNYSAFETLRASELLLQQKIYEKQQKKIAHMRQFVERFRYKASKARQAQSRLKAIERIELVSAVQAESSFQFEFFEPKECPYPLLRLEDAQITYGEKIILSDLNLTFAPDDRIAVLGPNGAGKSSLIKLLAGQLNPSKGIRDPAPGLVIGYFAQHQIEQLHLDQTPLQHLRDLAAKQTELELRKYLGSFGFSNNRVLEPVHTFSGGEKSRLALALLVWQRPNLLLLDEPTNHLDLDMRNALTIALQEYVGAMILISHDRFLVRATTDHILLVADGKIQKFDGDLEDYQRWLFDYRKTQSTPGGNSVNTTETTQPTQKRAGLRALNDKIKRLELQLTKLQTTANQLEAQLADQSLYEPQNHEKLQTILLQFSQIKKDIEQVETAWLEACEEREP